VANHRDDGTAATTMARDIRPLSPDDLPELSRFLATGFQARLDADFAAPAVLRWKYLEPLGSRYSTGREGGTRPTEQSPQPQSIDSRMRCHAPLSYVALDQFDKIVGHLGLCRTYFQGKGITAPYGQVGTMHIIDWLGSTERRAIGISLMRLAHQGAETQFGLGVSPSALLVGERAGYQLRGLVPVYNRVLRTGYWLRKGGLGLVERGLQLARDTAGRLIRQPGRPRAVLTLERVLAFGPEIFEITAKAERYVILTQRDPTRLNAFLRFPRQDFSGWYLRDETRQIRGFALLNIVPHDEGRTRTGKIVDCLLDGVEVAHWHAAILALVRALAQQGADIAQCYGSTPWMSEALAACGFISRFGVKFHIRDPQELIPREAMFHLTTLEGDYAYT
jgi:hypothetical protein